MTIQSDVERMAMEKMIDEAKSTSKELANGAGVVASCPAHASLAKGVRLCLDLTVCILQSTARGQRRGGVYAGLGGFAAVFVAKFIEQWLSK